MEDSMNVVEYLNDLIGKRSKRFDIRVVYQNTCVKIEDAAVLNFYIEASERMLEYLTTSKATSLSSDMIEYQEVVITNAWMNQSMEINIFLGHDKGIRMSGIYVENTKKFKIGSCVYFQPDGFDISIIEF